MPFKFYCFENSILNVTFCRRKVSDCYELTGGGPVLMVRGRIVTRILLELLGKRASESCDWHARDARGSSKSSMKGSRCVYRSRTRFLKEIVFNSSQLSRNCFHCWSIRNIILILVRLSLTNRFTRTNPSHFVTLKEGDLTTLNTLRMFTSRQRNLAPNIISATTSRINNHFDDRVKINKFDVYKGERDELNDWLI